VVIYRGQGADLHMAQLMPLALIVSCFNKIQIGFTFLVPAHLGSLRQNPQGCKMVVVVVVVVAVVVVVVETRKPTQSHRHMHTHAGSAFENHMIFTFFLAERLPCNVCLQSLVMIAQAFVHLTVWTLNQTYTQSQIQLIMLPTARLPVAWVITSTRIL